VTAAITLVSVPVAEVAVLGRAVRGRAVPGVERVADNADNGLFSRYGALRLLAMDPAALAGVEGF
jgi:hypothetical protein